MTRRALSKRLAARVVNYLPRLKRERANRRYFKQPLMTVRVGSYELECPAQHLLHNLGTKQPYRDLCVGIAARFIGEKYPSTLMIDVGANIGDTAAMISSHTTNPLLLVEGSPYFFDILQRNARQLPNVREVIHVLVSDTGGNVTGGFHHWGGTALFVERSGGDQVVSSLTLAEIADPDTCFVKLDTDGHDFRIVCGSLDWFENSRAGLLVEDQILAPTDLEESNEMFARLSDIGYTGFIVWDDAGFHILSTRSVGALRDLNRYLWKQRENDAHHSISNYDVLCLHERDADIFSKLVRWWAEH